MMDTVKKNLVSIICGVIAIVAVVAIYWPINGYYTELQKKADERAGVYRDLSTLASKPRSWPNISLKDDAQGKPLDMYPTEPVIAKGKELIESLKAEKNAMYETLVSYNKHTQLVPDALPDAPPGAAGLFKARYKQTVDMSVLDNRATSPLVLALKGGFLPTIDQITNAKNAVQADVFAKKAVRDLRNPNIILNRDSLEEEVKLKQASIQDTLRREVAENSQIYLFPGSLDQYTPITTAPPGLNPDPAQVWAAQVSLWVQEDITRAIAWANEGCKNVTESPIKQLLRLSVNSAGAFKPYQGGQTAAPSGKPNPADDLNPTKNYRSSITGRIACSLYDIVPFNMQMLVDGTQIPLVLEALSREKLITITTCSMDNQDLSPLEASGYYLGKNPLVKLTIGGEAMLLREWTIPMMPPQIRRGLGLPLDTEAPK